MRNLNLTTFLASKVIFVAFIFTLAACATRPSVTYTKITPNSSISDSITDSYFLQTSMIAISESKNGGGSAPDDILITSTPTEYPPFKVGITSNTSWGGSVSTAINITKMDNTSLVKEIGSQITDTRVDTIKAIGGIVTTVLPLVGFSGDNSLDASKLPWSTKTYTQIETATTLPDGGKGVEDGNIPLQLKDGVTMTLGPLPPDAVPISKFPTSESNVFIYAACRDATISFSYTQIINGKKVVSKHTKTLKISDPRYYEVAAFPVKGKITTHTECGVSVTTDPTTGVSSTTDVVSALATQGKAIKDAIDAAKKPSPAAK